MQCLVVAITTALPPLRVLLDEAHFNSIPGGPQSQGLGAVMHEL